MSDIDVPRPGSPEAVALACTCPVIDNHGGKGALGGTLTDDNGEPKYWIATNCPLHSYSGVLLKTLTGLKGGE